MHTRKDVENVTPAVTPNARAKMSVYTRTGDLGKTSLFAGKRVSKASLRVKTYGSLDELNSVLGVTLTFVKDGKIKKELKRIQNDLFEIGAELSKAGRFKNLELSSYLEKRVFEFENIIDSLTTKLPELNNFILPGGGKGGSFLHLARTIARKVERSIVALSEKENVEGKIIVFINRLSDLLFMMARMENKRENRKEIIWNKR